MNDKVNEDVRTLETMVNSFSFNPKKVAEQFANEAHRTLQQTFTSLCLEWLNVVASDDYRFDGRNELSHKVAKELLEGHEVGRLPMI